MSFLDAFEAHIENRDRAAAEVSKWSVGMQVHHSLKVAAGVFQAVAESEPGAEKPTFSFLKFIVMLTGRIPRGKAKAPKIALPEESPSEEELRQLLDRARKNLKTLKEADPACYFKHFKFGVLNRDQSVKFVEIHSRHHLHIIDDILKAST